MEAAPRLLSSEVRRTTAGQPLTSEDGSEDAATLSKRSAASLLAVKILLQAIWSRQAKKKIPNLKNLSREDRLGGRGSTVLCTIFDKFSHKLSSELILLFKIYIDT